MKDNEKAVNLALNISQSVLQAERENQAITPSLISEKVDFSVTAFSLNLSTQNRDFVISELVRRFSHWIGKDSALDDNEGHVPWLVASRKKEWRYWQRYQTYLERKLSVDVVSALDESTDGILSRLEDPLRDGAWDRRGLVVGHVQSGKTGNYSGLVCKAADAGYKIIIVLAGLHNNLRSQTQIRLEESFLGYETSENRDPGKPLGVAEIDSDPSIHPHCATTRADNGDFNAAVARHFAISPEQRPWLFVVKKQKTVLTQLLKWINGHVADTADSKSGRRLVTKFPLLVIDDEADNASVDTGEQWLNDDGTPNEEYQPKTINSLIRQILHAFDKSAYVGYTATPFANIFIHRRGATAKEGPDLFPKAFIVNLAAPSNYVGPTRMFGLRTPEGRMGGLPLARYIHDHVIKDNHGKEQPGGWMPSKHKKDHIPLYDGVETLPPSLIEAIQCFVLACAARKCRGQGSEHSSMLVHVTRFTNVQKEVYGQIQSELNRMRQKTSQKVDHSELMSELEQLWNNDFVNTSHTVSEILTDSNEERSIPNWNEILTVLADTISDITVKIVNGTAKDALDYAEYEKIGLKVIAVGGDKLARGLTLEGLCTSYFVRTTKMYDTLMQMGRWFGYRPGYVDLCRLYTSEDLVDWFGHIADASEELREEFEAMAERNATPENYGLRVQSHPVLLVTSPLKMRTATNLQLSFSGELLETVSLYKDSINVEKNIRATNTLIKSMGTPSETDPERERGDKQTSWTGSYLWSGVKPEPIAEFFESYVTHPNARKVNSKLLGQFVRNMAKSGELTSWTVALIGGGSTHSSYTFDLGMKVDLLKRSDETHDKNRYSIGRLLSPRDEAIDLHKAAWVAALGATVRSWKLDATKQKKGTQQPEVPNGPAIRRIRGKGAEGVSAAPERGVLLLYPLDPKSSGGNGFGNASNPVVAFGVSFPTSDNGVKVEYAVDHLLWEQEYGSGE